MVPPANQPERPPQQRQAPGRRDGTCFNCGERGHWYNECPHPPRARGNPPGQRVYQRTEQTEIKSADGGQRLQTSRAVAPGRNRATSGYLEVEVEGRPVQCLLDQWF